MEITIQSIETLSYLDPELVLEELNKKIESLKLDKEKIVMTKLPNDTGNNFVTKETMTKNEKIKDTLFIYIDGYIYGEKGTFNYDLTTLFGYRICNKRRMWNTSPISTPIYSTEGIPIAEFINNTLIINYNIFESDGIEISTDIMVKILEQYNMLSVLSKAELEKQIRKRALNGIIKVIEKTHSTLLRDRQVELDSVTSNISTRIENLKTLYTNQSKIIKDIETLQKTTDERQEQLIKELEQILKLDKVENIKPSVNGKEIIIQTKLLYGYTEHNRCFELAPYSIIINFLNGRVRFDCKEEYKKRSCWGVKCIHPHISTRGEACFGNVSSTVAQLLADVEIFALTTILINYLETINVNDQAGAYCTNWNEVNPETFELIKEGFINHESRYFEEEVRESTIEICAVCGNIEYRDNMIYCDHCNHYVCEECSIYIQDLDQYGCTECDDISYCEHCNEYYTTESMYTCEHCGNVICENCVIQDAGLYFCSENCIEEHFNDEDEIEETVEDTIQDTVQEDIVTCTWCEEELVYTELYTCESCGRQGCNNCIQLHGGKWECPECRGDIDV